MGEEPIAAGDDLLLAAGEGEDLVDAVLAVHEQGGLRGALGEGGAALDGNGELRAEDDGVELCDGRAELELQAQVVDERSRKDLGVAGFDGIGAAVEGASDRGQGLTADDAVGVGVIEAVGVDTEEGGVAGGHLAVEAEVFEEVAVVTLKDSGLKGGDDVGAAALLGKLAGEEEMGGVVPEQLAAERVGELVELILGDLVAAGSGGGAEAVVVGAEIAGTVEAEDAAMVGFAAAAGDDVDH